jgi:hypothetical protein
MFLLVVVQLSLKEQKVSESEHCNCGTTSLVFGIATAFFGAAGMRD